MLIDDVLVASTRGGLYHQKQSKALAHSYDPEGRRDLALEMLPEALAFDGTEVSAYVDNTFVPGAKLTGMVPCVAPLAEVMWVEWKTATQEGTPMREGVLILSYDLTSGNQERAKAWVDEHWSGQDVRWLYVMHTFVAVPLLGIVPTIDAPFWHICVRPDGTMLDRTVPYLPEPVLENLRTLHPDSAGTEAGLLQVAAEKATPRIQVALATLSFAHCKNVRQEVHAPLPGAQRMLKAMGKPPQLTYRTLVIDPSHAVVQHEQDRVRRGEIAPKALHLVRGHFAEYGINGNGKLFGKYEGRYFVPLHVRGTLAAGAVVKDYEVKAEPAHATH